MYSDTAYLKTFIDKLDHPFYIISMLGGNFCNDATLLEIISVIKKVFITFGIKHVKLAL